jgi:hypothetical protein
MTSTARDAVQGISGTILYGSRCVSQMCLVTGGSESILEFAGIVDTKSLGLVQILL